MAKAQEFEKVLEQSDMSAASFESHIKSPLEKAQHFLHSSQAAVPLIVLILSVAVFGIQVAHDAVGFPQDKVAVLYGRDEAIGIHFPVGFIIISTELSAPIDALELDTKLPAAPEYLLDIRGIRPAPDFDHCSPPIT